MFHQILIVLHQLLGSELHILIEQIHLGQLWLVVVVDLGKNTHLNDREHISKSPQSDIGGDDIVIVRIEELA